MDAYTGFAAVYDQFMNNVPYEEWAAFLAELLQEHGIAGGLLLELGCGTGTMTELMAARGYDMIGIDSSENMLAEAMDKRAETGLDILYLCQDMRSFELYGTVAAIYSICDSLNYILDYAALVQVFRLANNYLDPKGILLFDFNTAAAYRDPLRQVPIVETADGDTMIWENCYDEDSRINEHRITFFLEEEDGLYSRIEELHRQRAYSLKEIRCALKEAGLIYLTAFGEGTRQAPGQDTARIYIIARENGK